MTTNNATPRDAIENVIDNTARAMSRSTGYTREEVWLDNPDECADAVIALLWEQVDSYDFFDALETWVLSNENYEPDEIARFTAEYLLGPRPQENDHE